MSSLPLREVDVFCTDGFDGNPLAVVHDADGLTGEQMQRIANWTNLSETSFLLAPSHAGADYQVRIFTPFEELPFAGHPTLGSAHAWLEAGGLPRIANSVVQECGIGLVTLTRRDGRLAFEAPPLITSGPPDGTTRARTLAVLGVEDHEVANVEWIDNGPRWIGVELVDPMRLGTLSPKAVDDDPVDIAVFCIGSELSGVDVELRCFFGTDVREDPVTGSANASVAMYLRAHDKVRFPYVAAQGNYIDRNGRAYVSQDDDDRLWIGGRTTTLITGHIQV